MNGKAVCEITCAEVSPLREEALFRFWMERMPASRRRKVLAMRHAESQRLRLGVGILLFQALERRGIPGNEEVAEGEFGQPYLPGHPEWRISLSHAGTRALCAVSDRAVGCDVEEMGRGSPDLVRRFFHPEEQQALEAEKDPEAWDRLFTRLWTRKESYLKATGRGIQDPLEGFSALESGHGIIYGEKDLAEGYCFSCCVLAEDAEFRWAVTGLDRERCGAFGSVPSL